MDWHADFAYSVRRQDRPMDGSTLINLLRDRTGMLLTTPTVFRLYRGPIDAAVTASGGRLDLMVLDCRESTKTLETVERVCARMIDGGQERTSVLIAVGGGVCIDIATMSASLFKRGIEHVRIPTTLVGQVDAGIGVKAAVNFVGRKSAIGCFHPPQEVLIDPAFLATLPIGELRAGLGEVVKIAVVEDASLFEMLADVGTRLLDSRFQSPDEGWRVIHLAALRMLQALAPNLFENQTYQRSVDAGHTFSPRLEAAAGFALRHGEAVAVDIAFSATIAVELGMLAPDDRDAIVDLLQAFGLPLDSPHLDLASTQASVIDAVHHRGGWLNLPLPRKIGEVDFLLSADDLPPPLLKACLDQHRRMLRRRHPSSVQG